MPWRSVQLTQNGNTTTTRTFGPHSALSNRDNLVVGPIAGNSWLRVNWFDVRRNPIQYRINVTVLGAGAMSFRVYAEKMN